jgi:DNA-binding response OmpR family regulator
VGVKILFVDNHPEFTRTVIAAFLGGHRVRVVATVSAATEALQGEAYDLALVDYDLDDGKGTAFVGWARRAGYHLPMVAVSARDEGNALLSEAGADAVCSKTGFAEIGAVIDALLRG